MSDNVTWHEGQVSREERWAVTGLSGLTIWLTRVGEIRGLTGVDDPYEAPRDPDVDLLIGTETGDRTVQQVIDVTCDDQFMEIGLCYSTGNRGDWFPPADSLASWDRS